METQNIKISNIAKKHCPKVLDGRLILCAINEAIDDTRRHMQMTGEERERELYETLKRKYEKET